MMASQEEQELMAQIGHLAGRINRHRARDTATAPLTNASRGSYRAAPYPQAIYRGRGRGRYTPPYRNRTLVNNVASNDAAGSPKSGESSWVSRNDRHMQIINSSIYEKDSQSRSQAIQHTQRQKLLQSDRAERQRIMSSVNRTIAAPSSSSSSPAPIYEIMVEGIRFQVVRGGSKLIRATDSNATTPKTATIGGVLFHRTKNGNLIRHGIIKAQQRLEGIKKVNTPCSAFSWTGSCPKGPQCRYTHDPTKVAICREWLSKGACQDGNDCDLSHEATEERTPLCVHFAKGKCNNESCSYVHAEHSSADPVCRDFGVSGYCSKGAKCPGRHVFECPDFSNKGACRRRGCKLLHRERASVMRKAGAANSEAEADEEDVSSDEHDFGVGDDVDSDEVEEFIGKDGDDLDFLQQKDFIEFR